MDLEKRYMVIRKETVERLERSVEEALNQGYTICGGVCVDTISIGAQGYTWYYQAMERLPDAD